MIFMCCAADSAMSSNTWSSRQPPRPPQSVESSHAARRESIQTRRGSTADRSRGRIVRIVLVGNMENKIKLAQPSTTSSSKRRIRRASSISSHLSISVGDARIIFNEVPPRDLDNPNHTSDFEEFIAHADAAIIVADAFDSTWRDTAERWRIRLSGLKKLPFALLITASRALSDDHARDITNDAEAFANKVTDCVGWFLATNDTTESKSNPSDTTNDDREKNDDQDSVSTKKDNDNGIAYACISTLVDAVRGNVAH